MTQASTYCSNILGENSYADYLGVSLLFTVEKTSSILPGRKMARLVNFWHNGV
jgi:hypothetical protein